MTNTCMTCNGKRVITDIVPETYTRTIFHSFPVSECTERSRVTVETGRMVPRSRRCHICNGSGKVAAKAA